MRNLFKSLVCFDRASDGSLQLSQKEPFACLLLSSLLVFNHFLQVRDGLFIFACMDVIVCVRVIPFFNGTPIERVALYIAYHIFGIIQPSLLNISLCKPCACFSVYGRLRLIQSAHIRKGRCRLFKSTLMKLCFTHH